MRRLLIVAYIFLFLFAPPIVPGVNISFILGACSLLIIIFKYNKRLIELIKKRSFITFLIVLFFYYLLYLIAFFINYSIGGEDIWDNFILNTYSIILNFVVTFICAICLVFVCQDLKIDKYELIKLFIYAGLIQSCFAIISLINQDFRSIMT